MILLVALACREPQGWDGVTETGNPEFTAGVSVSAKSSDPEAVSVNGNGETDVDGLWMAVDGVQVFTARECEDETVPSFVDAFVTDATAPQVQSGTTEATDYCGARIQLTATDAPQTGPPELAGHTLVMTGVSDEGWPFLVRTRLDFDVPLFHDEGDFAFNEENDRMDVGVDLSVWLDAIDVNDGQPDASGTIVIDESSNPELLWEFEEDLLDAMDVDIVED